jgi:hypothetical protein
VSLIEASGDDGNRRDKMACGRLRVATMTSTSMGFNRGIKDNKVKEVIVGVNPVV